LGFLAGTLDFADMGSWCSLLPICALAVLGACSAGATQRSAPAPAMPYRLSEESAGLVEDDPALGAQLDAVLGAYFGVPGAPSLRRLDGWSAVGFDPSASPFELARPEFDLGGLTLAVLREDNRRTWAAELRAVERGDFDTIGPFQNRRAMSEDWRALLARRGELGAEGLQRAAREFFSERYPDLREAGQLFGVYCARCHGLEGGGNGPMSGRIYPKPRDYRRGRFKFAAVDGAHKPRRADFLRTLLHGLPGSAMPSFRVLSNAELNGLVDYVRLLSIRGEVEAILVSDWLASGAPPEANVAEVYELVWGRWLEAEQHAVRLEALPADEDPGRWELGRAVFLDPERGNCFRCHGPAGRGDGPSALRVDEEGREFVILRDEWGEFILPRDLTSGVFRGGERREDVYLRVHCGIPGTPMPSMGESLGADGRPLLDARETWALVDYVLSLSGKGPFGSPD
jgi:mono/diheme cytochrome c family protein